MCLVINLLTELGDASWNYKEKQSEVSQTYCALLVGAGRAGCGARCTSEQLRFSFKPAAARDGFLRL